MQLPSSTVSCRVQLQKRGDGIVMHRALSSIPSPEKKKIRHLNSSRTDSLSHREKGLCYCLQAFCTVTGGTRVLVPGWVM